MILTLNLFGGGFWWIWWILVDPEVSEMKTKNSIKTLAEHIFGIYAERAPKTTQTNPKTKRKMLADSGLERVDLAENRRFFVGDGVMWMLWPIFRLLNPVGAALGATSLTPCSPIL